jgi:preprotein translocase subunit SecB
MEDTIKEKQFSFQIKGIELLDVKLNYPKQPLSDQITFHFKIGLEQKISLENRLIIVITTIDVVHEDTETRLASLQVSCIYEIANFEDFIIEGTQQVTIPDAILVTLNSVSISTVRGIMFSQFKGTFLHNAILPVVDPKAFVKNNAN